MGYETEVSGYACTRCPFRHLRLITSLVRYGADPRDPPTREALAKAEGRELEPLSEEELAIDADAIGCLMETVLSDEKRAKVILCPVRPTRRVYLFRASRRVC